MRRARTAPSDGERRRRRSLALAALAAAAVLSVAVPSLAEEAGTGDGTSPPEHPQSRALLDRELERERSRRLARDRPEARRRRAESTRRHEDLAPDKAEKLARERFRELGEPAWSPPSLEPGERFADFLSDHAVRIERGPGEPASIVESLLPLRAEDPSGEKAPLDMTVERKDDAYEPKNPLVRTKVGRRSGQGVRFERSGVRLKPEQGDRDAEAREGESGTRQGEGGLLYPRAGEGRDTDLVVKPLPTGVETFHVVRSKRAAERQAFELELPNGAELREVSGGGAEVRRGDEVLLTVSPPQARDAEGEPVPVSLRVDGRRVVLEFPHRSRDVEYPLIIDPTWEQTFACGGTTVCGRGTDDPTDSGWRFDRSDSAFHPYTAAGDPSLYVLMTSLSASPYSSGMWSYRSPSGAYVYRTDFQRMYHLEDRTCAVYGLYHPVVGWERGGTANGVFCNGIRPDDGICARDGCATTAEPGNWAVFYLMAYGTGNRGRYPYARLGGARVYLHDSTPPVLGAPLVHLDPQTGAQETLPTGWTNRTSYSVRMRGIDHGLGLKRFRVKSPGQTVIAEKVLDCGVYCPNDQTETVSYSLPEGVNPVKAVVRDNPDHPTSFPDNVPAAHKWQLKVDKTAPTTTTSGTLKDANGKRLVDGRQYGLRIEARDFDLAGPRAGVQSIDILVDGRRVDGAIQPCPATTDSCPLSRDFTVRPDEQSEGKHEVKVVARDRAGNERSETYTVHVGNPGLGERPTYTFEDFALDSGVKLRVNVANGNLVVRTNDVDIEADFGFPVIIDRFYNSLADDVLSSLGQGWTAGLGPDIGVRGADTGAVTLAAPSGDLVRFARNADGSYRTPSGVDGTLTRNDDGSFVMNFHDQEDRVDFRGANLAMQAITDEDGHRMSVDYKEDGAIDKITDTRGRVTRFTTNADRLVTAIDDPDGGHVQYVRDGSKRLVSVTGKNGQTTQFKYNLRGYLSEVVEPGGERTLIAYDEETPSCRDEILRILPAPIGGETVPRTCRVKSVTRGADTWGNGSKTTFGYEPGMTSVTDASGRPSTYRYDDQLFVTDRTHGAGAPSLHLSGSLAAAAGAKLADAQDYELRAEASGPGLESTELFVNGKEADESLENCPEECTQESDKRWLVNSDYFRGGEYLARVVAETEDGDRHEKAFKFHVNFHPDDGSPQPPPQSAEDRREEARSFRTNFGLDASDATLDRVLSDPSLSEEKNGTPLTPEEDRYVDDGQRLQGAAKLVAEYGEGIARDAYGGLYLDFRNGGFLYAGFTRETGHHLAELLKTFPFPAKLRIYPVERTLAELASLRERVIAERQSLVDDGVDVQEVHTHLKDNVIEVGVPTPTRAAADVLARRYGPGARLVEGLALTPDQSRVASFLYAGLRLDPSGCTSNVPAFQGRRAFLLTAGHCARVGDRVNRPRERPFGRVTANAYTPGSTADALAIAVVDPRRVARRSIHVGGGRRRNLTGVQPLPGPETAEVGQRVCRFGNTSGLVCGLIVDAAYPGRLNRSRLYPATQLYNLRRVAMRGCQGDSGAPVFIEGPAGGATSVGVHNGSEGSVLPPVGGQRCGSVSAFSHIAYAQQRLGVAVGTQRR